ncbi:hypothetical protein COW36_11605 [bacterium (Candidatus Blackallbacteria) CG17_big_fil_post_rev_8_21_14_2_50_48_46]|uniref:Uncharacterized protein n=1 Tax=bacterium (Candidatus Blackallbacteria) CG17_big_fil_post_rev_8_21_14_2_50_48_46 TaxID=2014261 RepID=A0A2M7G5E2_9BACT|nr:MAG: hypothetical protein COW64_21825 [bacterium (Candidatus Blackallbacteria) CG18_big_fil_WC_8_21_14_2_50_49_26]PIW16783.1 MAG: hypothetical protein COW36_11605 [bacterium (Candidatus Blackallbacteria) CG17_big_fil_post_rev_8_21_14_2_50_48_46]PIW47073.1 MAG: hypothetical protein COW20_13815 [bacterium (Candidatus Blackallbacteria) CG13_big_fil_rev_8_21_14_2_50_49_14]
MHSDKIGWTQKMNESIANDQETGQIPSDIINKAKSIAKQNNIPLDTSVLDYLKRKNDALKLVMAIDSSKITDAFGKNSDGTLKKGTALVTFATWHTFNTGSEQYTMKLQMTFNNGKWSKIECKN